MGIIESNAPPELASVIAQGIEYLSGATQYTFNLFIKFVSPIDGLVYWIPAPNSEPVTVAGSFHITADQQQNIADSKTFSQVWLSTQTEIPQFRDVGGDSLYCGVVDGRRYAFNSQGKYYRQANVFHYAGDILYPTMETQFINSPDDITLTVTNSLPVWLAHPLAGVPIFPAYLVPKDQPPPYVSVFIPPEKTETLALNLRRSALDNPDILARDEIVLNLVGLSNAQAFQYVRTIENYLRGNIDGVGLAAPFTIHDDHETQTAFSVLAKRKRVILSANYHQKSVVNVARGLITSAFISITSGV
jgi:hypothetical protein